MAWRDTLIEMRDKVRQANPPGQLPLDSQDRQYWQDHGELYRLAASLGIAQILLDCNEVLLGGMGKVESTSNVDFYLEEDDDWEPVELGEPGELNDQSAQEAEDDGGAELCFSLSWETEIYQCHLDIDLGMTPEGEPYLLVNGEEIPRRRENLEDALLEAYQEEIDF